MGALHKGFPYKTFMAWDTDKSGKITPDEARTRTLLTSSPHLQRSPSPPILISSPPSGSHLIALPAALPLTSPHFSTPCYPKTATTLPTSRPHPTQKQLLASPGYLTHAPPLPAAGARRLRSRCRLQAIGRVRPLRRL